MQYYRSKEAVEDCFDTTKNGLSDKRLHIHGDPQVDGKLFVMFIVLILRRTIHSRLKEYLNERNMTDEEAIRSLEKVIFYRKEGYWRLNDAISNQQREILTELRLELEGKQKTKADKIR